MDNGQDMVKRIEDWLEKGGYPLEMQVCRSFAQLGFDVIPSDFYIDSETGQAREIDLIATHNLDMGKYDVRFTYIIECKNNIDKPWIGFQNLNIVPNNQTTFLDQPSTKLGRIILNTISTHFPFVFNNLLYPQNRISYSITPAFNTSSDQAYTALCSVVKTVAHKMNSTLFRQKPICEIFIPLIVLGGRLFSGHLADKEKIKLKEESLISVYWRTNLLNSTHAMVLICTKEEINELAHKSMQELERLSLRLSNHSSDIIQAIKDELTLPVLS